VPAVLGAAIDGRLRKQTINGQLHIAIEDALSLAYETMGDPAQAAPLSGHVAARKAAVGEAK
jgi:hypothetical protein